MMTSNFEAERTYVYYGCLEAYYNASGKCLSKRYTTVRLPYMPDTLMNEFQASSLDNSHFQLRWREIFKKYDLPDNAKLECYEPSIHTLTGFAPIQNKKKVLKEGITPKSPPALTKIIQFYYDDIPWRYAYNPAVVTYYYGTKVLCSFDVYYEFAQSLGEIEAYAEKFHASEFEKEQLMNYCLLGEDIHTNPCDVYGDDGYPLDYLEFLRLEMDYYDEPLIVTSVRKAGGASTTTASKGWDDDLLAV